MYTAGHAEIYAWGDHVRPAMLAAAFIEPRIP